jgi:DNA-binding transcriptional ArsR family regulator
MGQQAGNIFIMVNMTPIDQLAALFQAMGQPARLQILLALSNGEACVCHLEALFGWRQAYLSQHLMSLREAGLVVDRRESRFIYYRLADLRLVDMLKEMAAMQGVSLPVLIVPEDCDCPSCTKRQA